MKNRKSLLVALFLMLICGVSLYAGTTDTLGLSATWAKIEGFLTDQYLTKLIAAVFFVLALRHMMASNWAGVFIFLILTVIVGSASTIVTAMSSAIF